MTGAEMALPGLDGTPFPVAQGHSVRWVGPHGFEAGRFVRWSQRRGGGVLVAVVEVGGRERRIDAAKLRPSNDLRTQRLRGGVLLDPRLSAAPVEAVKRGRP